MNFFFKKNEIYQSTSSYFAFQNLIVLSCDPETINLESGVNVQLHVGPLWPLIVESNFSVLLSHNLIVVSSLTLKTRRPLGEKQHFQTSLLIDQLRM